MEDSKEKKGSHFKAFLHYYLRRELPLKLASGLALAGTLIVFLHTSLFFQEKQYAAVTLIFLSGLLPILTDFASFFYYNSKYGFFKYMNNLIEKLIESKQNGNKFLIKAAINRIGKDSTLMEQFFSKKALIHSLDSLEYIRVIFIRILVKIMGKRDYYFTLSNLDFWTAEPINYYPLPEFVKINYCAALYHEKYIYRIIAIDESLIPTQPMIAGQSYKNDKQEKLATLITEMADSKMINVKGDKHLNTYFYCTRNIHEFESTPFAFVVSEDLNYVMLAKAFRLEDSNTFAGKRKDSPYIRIHFHNLITNNSNFSKDNPLEILENLRNRYIDQGEDVSKDIANKEDDEEMKFDYNIQKLIDKFGHIQRNDKRYLSITQIYEKFFGPLPYKDESELK